MHNIKARLNRLGVKNPTIKRVVRIYWADGTFIGEMRYWDKTVLAHPDNNWASNVTIKVYIRVDTQPLSPVTYWFACNFCSKWCGWRDLNPHASRRQNLNLVRLPISPHPHRHDLVVWSVISKVCFRMSRAKTHESEFFLQLKFQCPALHGSGSNLDRKIWALTQARAPKLTPWPQNEQ